MDLKDISDNVLKSVFDVFVKKIENIMCQVLPLTGYKNLDEMVENDDPKQKTQSKTKFLAYFYEQQLMDSFLEHGIEIERSGIKGSDYKIFKKLFEAKLSLSGDGSGWTGNNYSLVKVNDYILIKLQFDENNKVTKSFFGILSLDDDSLTKWSFNNEKKDNAFSNMKIRKEDIDKIRVIKGDMKVNPKFIKDISV